MIALFDPTRDASERRTAAAEATEDVVGWAASVVTVRAVRDAERVGVLVQIWDAAPDFDVDARPDVDLDRTHQLALPSGTFAVDTSVDAAFRRGLELPAGAGTYRVRVLGFRRRVALDGVESYRFVLWRVGERS